MADVFVKVILALLAVAFVAYPLLTPPREEGEDLDLSEDLDELHRRKESTYSAIKELESDFRTGKLSEEDFHELDARYRADALEFIAAIEARQEVGRTAARDGGDAAPVCGDCGALISPDHRFCASCGADVARDQGSCCA